MKRNASRVGENRSWISPGVMGTQGVRPGASAATARIRVPAVPAVLVRRLAKRLLQIPTAPCHEHRLREEVRRICLVEGLAFAVDEFGNAFVSLNTAPGVRPLVLAAHLDHPGFDIVGALGGDQWQGRFQGGVPDEFFRRGTKIRFQPGDMPGELGVRLEGPKDYVLRALKPLGESPRFAVWDLEPFALRDGRIVARGCDDVVGSAAALAVLIQLRRMRAKVNVLAVLSRAEEIGFYGALALAGKRMLPRGSLVISLETSKEMPPVLMGKGVIIRVGDRASVFDPKSTRFLGEVAADLQVQDRRFRYQRALMSGGTCEATAYLEGGYDATGLCVALGNYHNCGSKGRIAEEYVGFEDVRGMVRLLVAVALAMPRLAELTGRLGKRLKALRKEAVRRLVESKEERQGR